MFATCHHLGKWEKSISIFFRAKADLSRKRRANPTPAAVTYLPALLVAVLAVLVGGLAWAREFSGQTAALVALCLAAAALLAKLIVDNGSHFVNKPVTSPEMPRIRGQAAVVLGGGGTF